MAQTITITLTDPEAVRLQRVANANGQTIKQYIVAFLIQQVLNLEQQIAAQNAEATVTPINPT